MKPSRGAARFALDSLPKLSARISGVKTSPLEAFYLSDRISISARTVFVLVLGTGIALRLWMLGTDQLWLDEVHSIATAGNSAREMVSNLRADGHPPLYFSLALAWKSVFGESELSLRSISVLFGAASLLAIYWLGAVLFDRRTGMAAMFLAAIAPLHINYSQEARMYIMEAFFSTLMAGFLWLALTNSDKKRYWRGYTVAAICIVYTHIFGWLLVPVGAVFLLLEQRYRHLLRRLLLCQSVVVLAFLPWAPFVPGQMRQAGLWVARWWSATPPALAIPKTLECFGVGGNYPEYLPFAHESPFRIVSAAVFLLLAVSAVLPWKDKATLVKTEDLKARKVYVLLHLFLPLLMLFAISFVKPVYLVGRYELVAYPFFAAFIAFGVRKLRRYAPLGLAVLALLATYSLYKYYSTPTPAFDKESVKYLRQNAEDADVVVVVGLRLLPVEYYARREGGHFRIIAYPLSMRDHPGWIDFSLSEEQLRHDALAVMARALVESRPGRPVWLLITGHDWLNQPLIDTFEQSFQFLNFDPELGVILCVRR